jgi:hypothetical protein
VLKENGLRVLRTTFITEDGEKIEKDGLTNEQYQVFCDEFESARVRYRIKWNEFDKRYSKKE